MTLPDEGVPWPPYDTDAPRELFERWGAWYSGDPARLAHAYGALAESSAPYGYPPRPRPSQLRGGVVGRVARWFWGTPSDPGRLPARVHLPLAGDIASASAGLLFGEAPVVTVRGSRTQERLDRLMGEGGMLASLYEGAELASAYGGVYMRVGWDSEVADHPLVDAIAPDTAAPEWRSGHLSAVTFWRVLEDPDGRGDTGEYWRHLERHEPGRVIHGLFRGAERRLGTRVDLRDHPATVPFAAHVGSDGGFSTGHERLTAVYWPNLRPNRLIRGTPLGRSDYAGVEQLMDALDEAWSSWMRDVRLAKARLTVPRGWLESQGVGKGALFDGEREIFEPLDMLQGAAESAGDMLSLFQPDIRAEQHAATCAELAREVVHNAGYSTQTYGRSGEVAATATEVAAKERRSFSTRDRKIGYALPALARLSEAVLAVDAAQFSGRGVEPQRPEVQFSDGVQESAELLSRIAKQLEEARAASTRTKVQLVHPDWDSSEVDAEVDRIRSEDPPVDPAGLAGLVNGQESDEGSGDPQGGGDGRPERGGAAPPGPPGQSAQ